MVTLHDRAAGVAVLGEHMAAMVPAAAAAETPQEQQSISPFSGLAVREPKLVVRRFTVAELAKHTTEEAGLFIAAAGKVFDVTAGKAFYGPGGGYHHFAGRDASRGLAKSSLDPKTLDEKPAGDLSGLTDEEEDVLEQWVARFEKKYGSPIGMLLPDIRMKM